MRAAQGGRGRSGRSVGVPSLRAGGHRPCRPEPSPKWTFRYAANLLQESPVGLWPALLEGAPLSKPVAAKALPSSAIGSQLETVYPPVSLLTEALCALMSQSCLRCSFFLLGA